MCGDEGSDTLKIIFKKEKQKINILQLRKKLEHSGGIKKMQLPLRMVLMASQIIKNKIAVIQKSHLRVCMF